MNKAPEQTGETSRPVLFKRWLKTLLIAKFLLVLAVLVASASALRNTGLLESLAAERGRIEAMGPIAAIVYPLAYAACNLLLLPAGILSILSGFFFGLWWGFTIVLAGNLLGAAGAFLAGRYLIRRWIEPRIHANRRLHAIDQAIAREGWKIIFLSQVHPLFPTSLLNYLYGISQMKFWPCMGWIAVGQTPGLFLYAYFGTLGQYGLDLLLGERRPASLEIIWWCSGLLVTLLIAWQLGRIALRALRNIANQPTPQTQKQDCETKSHSQS